MADSQRNNDSTTKSNCLIILRDLLLLVLYIVTSIFALISNALVCHINLQRRNNSLTYRVNPLSTKVCCFLLFNLAFVDGLTALTVPIQITVCSRYFLNRSSLSSYICVSTKLIEILTSNTSTLTICLIALDRYYLVRNPLKHERRLRMCQSIVLTWIFSILFTASCFMSIRVPTYFNSCEKIIACEHFFPAKSEILSSDNLNTFRLTFSTIVFCFIPLMVISIVCLLTKQLLVQRSIVGARQFSTFEQSRTRSTRLLMIIIVVFAFSHLPIHSAYLQELFFSTSPQHPIWICSESSSYQFFYWLRISSCCYNPLIYSWFNRRFRSIIWKISHRSRLTAPPSINYTSLFEYHLRCVT